MASVDTQLIERLTLQGKTMNIEPEKIKRMIISAMNGEKLEAIQKMAKQEDVMGAIAAYILDPINESPDPEVVQKVSEIVLNLSEYASYTNPGYNFPEFHNKSAWEYLAQLGQWERWEDIYHIVSLNYPVSNKHATEQRSIAAWAWNWTSYVNKSEREAAEEGRLCQRLGHCPRAGAGWAIASGLLLAIKWGWISPKDPARFLLDYCRWTSYRKHQVIGYPLPHLDLKREEISEEILQALAVFWDTAATELGKRHIKLTIPLVQSKFDWKKGVEYSIPERTFDEDVERFLQGGTLEKYVLFDRHCHFGSKSPKVQNPDDPFGEEVPLFELKVGTSEYPCNPTYEDAIAYVDSLQ